MEGIVERWVREDVLVGVSGRGSGCDSGCGSGSHSGFENRVLKGTEMVYR